MYRKPKEKHRIVIGHWAAGALKVEFYAFYAFPSVFMLFLYIFYAFYAFP